MTRASDPFEQKEGRPRGTLVERMANHVPDTPQTISSVDQSPTPRRRASDRKTGILPPADHDVHIIDVHQASRFALLMPDGPSCAQTEAFRAAKRPILRHAFTAKQGSQFPSQRAVLVTSAHKGDGKTHCALNLALSMAADRALEVLLVDADSRRGDVAPRLGLPAGPGLMDGLAQDVPPEHFIKRTSIENLLILPQGAPARNDAELLGSTAMEQFIRRMLEAAPNRIILFDTTALLVTATAPALAAFCGQQVVVVRADSTSDEDLASALGMLGPNGHPQLLLNRVTFRAPKPHQDGSSVQGRSE
jgi:Mrp family chromosome partitioning ATPase